MKKRGLLLTTLLAVLLLLPQTLQAAAPVKLWIHGKDVVSDVSPFIENNRTLVPLRVITENLGYEVTWDGAARKVSVNKDDLSATLTIGSGEVAVNKDGKKTSVTIEVPAKIKNNRTFVPLRAIGELFGEDVDWDKDNRTAIVGKGYTPKPKQDKPKVMAQLEQETLAVMRKEFKGVCDVEYNKESKTMILRPVGVVRTFFRNIANYPNLEKEYVEEWNEILETLRALSEDLYANLGIPFGIVVANPDDGNRMLISVRQGKVDYNFLTNPIIEK